MGATPAEGGSGTCLKGGTVVYPEVKLKDEDRDKRRGEIGMTGSERRYLKTHPWLTFKFDMSGIRADTWILLGEATSKCEHLARSVMPPAFAQELNKIYVERGALGTTAIEGNTLTEREVREIMEGRDRVPPSRAYQKQEIENIVDLFNDIACGGPGRGRVQICCKGAPGRDRPRIKARNINDSLPALRPDPGLCNRFGQPTLR